MTGRGEKTMYEGRHRPLISPVAFFYRVLKHGLAAGLVALIALAFGVFGYRFFEHLSWLDALLNASMILGGMGPVNALHTVGGKLFASLYALLSGLVFISIIAILVAPFAHRLMHKFHLEK